VGKGGGREGGEQARGVVGQCALKQPRHHAAHNGNGVGGGSAVQLCAAHICVGKLCREGVCEPAWRVSGGGDTS